MSMRIAPRLFRDRDTRSTHKIVDRRDDKIAETAIADARTALTGHDPEEGKLSLVNGAFGTRRETEIRANDRQTAAMNTVLKNWARREAISRMRLTPEERDAEEPPALHKATSISVDGRGLAVHIDGPGKHGRNIIAMPTVEQTADNTLRVKKGVRLVEIDLHEPTRGALAISPEQVVDGATNLETKISFCAEERARARAASTR